MTRLVAALSTLALAVGCGPGQLIRHGSVNQDALAAVRSRLPAARELDFERPVPVVAEAPDEIRATVAREIDDSYRPGDVEHLEAVYARLGLLPEGASLRAAFERLYEEEAAGFYDPRRKRLVLASRALRAASPWLGLLGSLTGHDLPGEFVAAHELTHALQDQHWGIPATPEPVTDAQGDRLLARHALLEGDATLAGFAYLMGGLDAGALLRIERELSRLPAELATKYPDVPDAVRATVAFQYQAGSVFAGWAFTAGGWAAVDRAEADPPESTEQVLHPARYFGRRDRPVAIVLRGTEELETAGWMRVVEDTLGELQVRVLAGRFMPAARAALVADGWGGDRLRALARGDDVLVVWLTAWDSPADAEEFRAAFADIRPEAAVERRDRRVLVLLGPPGTNLGTLGSRVWARATASG